MFVCFFSVLRYPIITSIANDANIGLITLNKLIRNDVVSRGTHALRLKCKAVRRTYRGLVVIKHYANAPIMIRARCKTKPTLLIDRLISIDTDHRQVELLPLLFFIFLSFLNQCRDPLRQAKSCGNSARTTQWEKAGQSINYSYNNFFKNHFHTTDVGLAALSFSTNKLWHTLEYSGYN